MKINKLYKILPLLMVFIISCNEDILDLQPLDAYSDAALWKDPLLTEAFVNGIYVQMEMPLGKFTQGNLVDETHRRGGSAQRNFNNSRLTPDQIPGWSGLPTWNSCYKAIRACNKVLENIETLPDNDNKIDGVTIKDRLTGEAYWLRAYFYFFLTSTHGGVPIITDAYELDDDFAAPRNTYAECVDFIASDLDLAAAFLPLSHSGGNKGRATKGGAMALKSRLLLYAASDLYNTTVFPGYTNPELIGYTDASRTARWQVAKDAAKAVIDLGIYSLYKANPGPTDSISQNFQELFLSHGNEEHIHLMYWSATTFDPLESSWENLSGSPGYHCRGSNTPLDNWVRDYERRDGTKFSWSNPDHAAAPYAYRDPRLYASIFHEGSKWRQRSAGEYPLDPVGVFQLGVWKKWNSQTNTAYELWGLDTRKGPYSPAEGSYTGYYIRKFMDPAVESPFFASDKTFPYIRYAEILLNYAEACIGLGEDDEARTYINMVRTRAGMPEFTESGIELRDRYRNERRIELAMEGHRFYDVRRWVIGPQAYVASYKVEIVYPLLPDNTTATVPTVVAKTHDVYAWLNKAYFLPIFRSEMDKNPSLIQNPEY
jgi:starch-binding outer membrane protein, SusD/RagB family